MSDMATLKAPPHNIDAEQAVLLARVRIGQ